MSYLISAWPADKAQGPVQQTRRADLADARKVAQSWVRDPAAQVRRVSIFDEIAGQVTDLWTLDLPAFRVPVE
jgi:hypothetical protein